MGWHGVTDYWRSALVDKRRQDSANKYTPISVQQRHDDSTETAHPTHAVITRHVACSSSHHMQLHNVRRPSVARVAWSAVCLSVCLSVTAGSPKRVEMWIDGAQKPRLTGLCLCRVIRRIALPFGSSHDAMRYDTTCCCSMHPV